jgi:putative DNA primase/helicase
MTAETIAKALGGRRTGATWMARCPAHADREPSLSIKDADRGKVLVRCHAGCDQQQVIAALKSRGIWQETDRRHDTMMRPQASAVAKDELDRDDAKRTQAALRIWGATVPGNGSLVETYLRSRGIVMTIPAALRFHAGIKHPGGEFWPAMVALVTRGADSAPLAIHRTFLRRDGHGKAPVEPQKMMLGPCRGGAVWLAPAGDRLMVAEGIETALSAMQATGRPAWAALSISGLRTLGLPDAVREVIVLSDGDEPGEAAALDAGLRWNREGRCVRIARPPRGFDFNDVLLGGTLRRSGDAA